MEASRPEPVMSAPACQHLPASSSQLPASSIQEEALDVVVMVQATSMFQNPAPTCRLTRGISAQAPEDRRGPGCRRVVHLLSPWTGPAACIQCCMDFTLRYLTDDARPGGLSFKGPVVHVPLACSAVVGHA
ncbi:hypothetical protein J3458_002035 [Metarhizium acridum]|uniref:uncharacterized protein n=1 Tax=Metarhizium acridum TaxID=92637 RepID=UPI001C6BC8CA|nr:hypothetical protein J3458_002035 [Metarhizium acridum]